MAEQPHSRIIAVAAKTALAPLGLQRKGRSRTWIDDHGWWIINVEFQPSGRSLGSYLNVGEQHLFSTDNYLVFENVRRVPGFTAFTGDETQFARDMQTLAAMAAEAVTERRTGHGTGRAALERLCESDDDLKAGIAHALLGRDRDAQRCLTRRIHPSWQNFANAYLAAIDMGTAQQHARNCANRARNVLRLPTATWDWDA